MTPATEGEAPGTNPTHGRATVAHGKAAVVHGKETVVRHVGLVGELMRASDSFGLLLALLVVDYMLLAFVSVTPWFELAVSVPISLTLLLALHTSHAHRRAIYVGVFAVVAALVTGVVNLIIGGHRLNGWVIVLISLLLIMAPYFILKRILGHSRVGIETILGAICVYIIIGLFFTLLYLGISKASPPGNPFLAQSGPHSPSDFEYFSFITLTTVGYGDLTPLSKVARMTVVLEAMLGQIFLVTLVARLVSMFGTEKPTQEELRAILTGDDDGSVDEPGTRSADTGGAPSAPATG